MNLQILKRELQSGDFRSLYLVHGEEVYLVQQMQEAILSALLSPEEKEMNLSIFDQDPPLEELGSVAAMVPFFGGRNVLLVRNTRFFSAGKKGQQEEKTSKKDDVLLNLLKNIPEQTTVLFVSYDKVDKRRKAYKILQDHGGIFEGTPLKGQELSQWLQQQIHGQGKSIEPAALEQILAAVSLMSHAALTFLDQEITKLALYIGERSRITEDDVAKLLTSVPEMSVFSMTDAMSRKNIRQALTVLADQIESGQPRLKLLGLLARHTRQLYQARALQQEGISQKELARELKLPPFVAEKIAKQSRAFTLSQLKTAMGMIKQADEDLKYSRELISLEKIIIYLCR